MRRVPRTGECLGLGHTHLNLSFDHMTLAQCPPAPRGCEVWPVALRDGELPVSWSSWGVVWWSREGVCERCGAAVRRCCGLQRTIATTCRASRGFA
jgi:hypothetical protein